MNSKLLHRISAIENEMDGEFDLRHVATTTLAECARSGQMDSSQIAAHVAAGELPIGDNHAGVVGFATSADTRRQQEADYRRVIVDSETASGVWYAEPEPEIAAASVDIVGAICGLLALGFIGGGIVWLAYKLSPMWPTLVALASF
jgi:hypothetical protein